MGIENIDILKPSDDDEPNRPFKHKKGCRRGELCKCRIEEVKTRD